LEGFRARGVEVLLLTDPVDDFWIGAAGEYNGKAFRSATQSGTDLEGLKAKDAEEEKSEDASSEGETATLIAALKQNLGEAVKDVRTSSRLTDSPVCLVAGEGDLDLHLERVLKAHGQVQTTSARVLEINPRHPLIRSLAAMVAGAGGADSVADAAHLLLDQARIVEGEPLPDPVAFTRRLAAVMEKGLTSS
jgi:molecular chaperone HtpG